MVKTARYASYVVELIRVYFPLWIAQKEHALSMDPYITGRHPLPIASNSQTKEEQAALREIAQTPYGNLIINSSVQAMKVTGIRSADDDEMPEIWRNLWVKNRMNARQVGIIKPSIAYGVSYSSLLPGEHQLEAAKRNTLTRGMATGIMPAKGMGETHPGEDSIRNPSGSVIWKNYSPKTMTAFFAEPQDHFPMVALNGIEQEDTDGKYLLFEVFDEEAVHYAVVRDVNSITADELKVTYIESRPHGFGITPIVAHSPYMDDGGGSRGELTPFLPLLHRIDQTIYDRLLVQRQAAWDVRTVSGLDVKNDQQAAKLKAGDFLSAKDPAAKFGKIEASPMGDHNSVHESDLRDLSAVSQTPPYMINGLSQSMQPEALGAITSGYHAKIEGYEDSMGESIEQCFRLASHIDPSVGEVSDFAEVRWRGFRPYSLTQVADALGKLAQQMEVPIDMLFEQVPFFTEEDVKRAIEGRERAKQEAMEQALATQESEAEIAHKYSDAGDQPGRKGNSGGNSSYQNGR